MNLIMMKLISKHYFYLIKKSYLKYLQFDSLNIYFVPFCSTQAVQLLITVCYLSVDIISSIKCSLGQSCF